MVARQKHMFPHALYHTSQTSKEQERLTSARADVNRSISNTHDIDYAHTHGSAMSRKKSVPFRRTPPENVHPVQHPSIHPLHSVLRLLSGNEGLMMSMLRGIARCIACVRSRNRRKEGIHPQALAPEAMKSSGNSCRIWGHKVQRNVAWFRVRPSRIRHAGVWRGRDVALRYAHDERG